MASFFLSAEIDRSNQLKLNSLILSSWLGNWSIKLHYSLSSLVQFSSSGISSFDFSQTLNWNQYQKANCSRLILKEDWRRNQCSPNRRKEWMKLRLRIKLSRNWRLNDQSNREWMKDGIKTKLTEIELACWLLVGCWMKWNSLRQNTLSFQSTKQPPAQFSGIGNKLSL